MALQVGIGFSQDQEPVSAAKEAALQAKKQLGEKRIDLALLFSTVHYDAKIILPIIFDILNQTRLSGSSTAGILHASGLQTRGIAIIALCSDETRFETSGLPHLDLSPDLFTTGKIMMQNAMIDFSQKHRKLLLTFVDNLIPNLHEFIAGVRSQLGPDTPVLGGGSSDNFYFTKTYQYHKNACLTSGASAIIFGGSFQAGLSSAHGWIPLGKPRTINEAERHTIKKIDNKPAKEIYTEFFEGQAEHLTEKIWGDINLRYPLGLKVFNTRNKYLLRYVINTLGDGSLVCQNYVAKNTEIHLMIGSKESWLSAAESAAREVKRQLEGRRPDLILVCESIGRHKILGKSVNKEIAIIRSVLGETSPFLGLYTNGEIYTPLRQNNPPTHIHNGTIMIMAFC